MQSFFYNIDNYSVENYNIDNLFTISFRLF